MGAEMKMNKKGVTLLELVIVMVIIAIGATLMVPNLGPWIQHYRLRSATRDIVSIMRVAQMRSVSQNTSFRVDFNSVARTYTLQRSTGGIWVTDGAPASLPDGVKIISNNFSGMKAVFNPDSTASSGTLGLNNKRNDQKAITVSPSTGRVTID